MREKAYAASKEMKVAATVFMVASFIVFSHQTGYGAFGLVVRLRKLSRLIELNNWFDPVREPPGLKATDTMYNSGSTAKPIMTIPTR